MSRQGDRRGHEPEVRISWLEEDMDRVDHRFEEVTGQIIHKATNLDTAIKGLLVQFELMKSEHKADFKELREETSGEISGNRKVLFSVLGSMIAAAIAFATAALMMRAGG